MWRQLILLALIAACVEAASKCKKCGYCCKKYPKDSYCKKHCKDDSTGTTTVQVDHDSNEFTVGMSIAGVILLVAGIVACVYFYRKWAEENKKRGARKLKKQLGKNKIRAVTNSTSWVNLPLL